MHLKNIMGVPFHPFLLSAYTIFKVYATNANEIPVVQNLRPLLVFLLVAS